MNEQKICFIYCVNDKKIYEESVRYINHLRIPEGYTIEIIAIQDAESMCSGYNRAMAKTDAKYKVYLHQDVFIINQNFLFDVIELFRDNKELGMLGVVGSKNIPFSGVWWESDQKVGQVFDSYNGKTQLQQFYNPQEFYDSVSTIDGSIMITQYDIPWREDLFNGWYYYDLSQCQEFIRAGFDVGIPKQSLTWCIRDFDLVNVPDGLEDCKYTFLKEYKDSLFGVLPLVSILIPTYNRPYYFEQALKSAINQSYPNIEIIIGDDSTNNETQILTEEYLIKYPYIKYIKNETNLGQFKNDLLLLELAKGDYINFLMDDDLFHPLKVEKMMEYFIRDFNEEISLVTSHRELIDMDGNNKGIFGNTDKIFQKDTILDGKSFGEFVLKNNFNCIGEPTTVLFRKKKLIEPFGTFNGREYGCNVDQASWLNLLSKGKAVFIANSLSYFRIHDSQQLNSPKMVLYGAIDYAHQVITASKKGFLMEGSNLKEAVTNCLNYCVKVFNNFNDIDNIDLVKKYKELESYIKTLQEVNIKISQLCLEIPQNKFSDKLPLVSILIPAYNQTKYLKVALESAINQTYPNIEIIIGDDSTSNKVKEFLKPYIRKYKNINYFKNERENFDYGYQNNINCFKRSKGEYINYLNHDDILHPEKIERMVKYFMKNPNVTLVTSVRQPIDEMGNKLPLAGAFSKVFEKDSLISGYDISRIVIKNLVNIIGEPTTVLFKRKYMEGHIHGHYNGIRYKNISDVANWFSLLQYGDVVYISDTLSYFRVQSTQNSSRPEVYIMGIIDWYRLIKSSYKKGIIKNVTEYKKTINKWLSNFLPYLENNNIRDNSESEKLMDELVCCYKDAFNELIYKMADLSYECIVCGNKIEKFLPYQYQKHPKDFVNKFDIIGSDIENFTCPECYCHDRTRHLVLFFNKMNIWKKSIMDKNILHIAPEKQIQKIIGGYKTKEYICGDLYPTDDSIIKLDITNIQYNDNYFDFIICNHVLEHVQNDIKAMQEFYRVLKPGGLAVLQTPYSPLIKESYEDQNINSKKLRKEFFGQDDHVRIYGLNFFKRLENVGFKLKVLKNNDLFSKDQCKKYGVNFKENLILVTKE